MENNNINPQQNNAIFWRSFWITIILLAVIYLALIFKAHQNSPSTQPIQATRQETQHLQKILLENEPKILERLQENLVSSYEAIRKVIDYEIDQAFQPLYEQIEPFSEFHYSVKGEYQELLSALSNETDKFFQEHFFKPARFNYHLDLALKKIQNQSLEILSINSQRTIEKLQHELQLSKLQQQLLSQLFHLSKISLTNLFKNFSANLTQLARGAGATVGAALIGTALSKAFTKKIATKLTIKTAAKTGTKFLGSSGATATGAQIGAAFGGPIGAVIGGAIGAVAGWFATDAIIINIEELFTKDEFQKELRTLLDQQKQRVKEILFQRYQNLLNLLAQHQHQRLEDLKHKQLKEIIFNQSS